MIVLYIIGGLILLFFIVAMLLPSAYTVEKTMVMNASAEKCFNMVADLNHYRDWNPWSKMEPDAEKVITGTPKTTGHRYAWKGKKIGQGQLTIKQMENHKSVLLDLEFFKPFKSQADDRWVFEDAGNGKIKVIWKNSGPLPFPMGRIMGPMITKNLNKQFEEGLNNIKALVE